MANAKRDENSISGVLGVSNSDGTTLVQVYADPATHRLLIDNNGGAGTQYADGATAATPTGNVIMGKNGTAVQALASDGSNSLKVHITANDVSSSGGTSAADGATFTAGTTAGTPIQGAYHSVIDTVTDGKVAEVGMTSKRGLLVNLNNAAGTEVGTSTTPLQVSLANTAANGTAVSVSGTVTTTPPSNASTNIAQLAGTTTDTNSGTKSAGTLRVVLATDQPALTNKLLVTPDSVALPANQSVNVSQINAVTPLMGNGTTGTGSQRVTIASDNTAFSVNAVESGTWTVQPGNTPNTSAWLTQNTPATSGGLTTFHLVSAGSTNATNVKASAGQVYGWYVYNSNAAARKLVFHNTSGTPTAGASVFFALMIPPTSAANVFSDTGIPFSSGIGITMVTDLTDAGATAVAANDLICNIFYK